MANKTKKNKTKNYVTICNLLSQDSIAIYINGTPLHIKNQYAEIRNKY